MESLVYPTRKGNAATDTRKVARTFGKAHKAVLKAVDNLEISPEFNRLNFAPIEYTDGRNRQQRAVLMTRAGFTRLVMAFTGKRAAAFKESYIARFDAMDAELRELRTDAPAVNLLEHTDRAVQVSNSKSINNHQFLLGGAETAIKYNQQNCLLHTGQRPNAIVRAAKAAGLPSRQRTSAKEVLRHTRPATACAMSLADEMCRHGADLADVAVITKQAEGVFAGMLRLGFVPAQLSQLK